MAISTPPTTRLSNAYIAQQILSQIQTNQANLFTVQQQLASGRRVLSPSDDAPAAARAITLQSLLERKDTAAASLTTNQSYLAASDDALSSVADLLSEMRATALSVTGNNVSDQERQAAIAEVDAAVNRLLVTANQTFRDRYLFAGSQQLSPPFVRTTNGIAYVGNDNSLSALSDINQLFSTNVTGNQAFGAYSAAQLGVIDLNPVLKRETRLVDLNGGAGISVGSIKVSDGTKNSIVNIAGAATIGDVARLLESNPPPGRTLTARVTSRGLEISLDGGHLSIDEVGGGGTAASLGIKRVPGVGPGPFVGGDLNPKLDRTSPVADLLGTRARAYVPALGANNDLLIEAASSGADLNGVKVKYVDDDWFQADPGISVGNEFAQYVATATPASAVLKFPGRPGLDNGIQLTATTPGSSLNGVSASLSVRAVDGLGTQTTYNSTTKSYSISVETGTTVGTMLSDINSGGGPFTAATTSYGNGAYVLTAADNNGGAGNTYDTGNDAGTLVVHIDPGKTTANQAAAAINAEGTFTAINDPSEAGNGRGTLLDSYQEATAVGTTAGGSGENLDLQHGLQITNGGQTFTIDFRGAATVEDLLNAINGSGAQVTATINAAGTGIDVRSRLSGSKFSIGENGGTLATQLGIRTLTANTALNTLNNGAGVNTASVGDDFKITSRDGTTYDVNLTVGNAAAARIAGAGANSGLVFSRTAGGLSGNQYSVQISDSGVGGGNSVSLVGDTLRYNVDLSAGFTAQNAVDLLAQNSTLSSQFTVRLDRSSDQNNDGSGNLSATAAVQLTGGTDVARTIGDVLNLINNNPANLASSSPVSAKLNDFGNGITVENDGPLGSAPFSITRLGTSSAAQDLGLIAAADTATTETIGTKATTTLAIAGAHNDLVISSAQAGAALNGVTVRFANDGVAGNNSANYDTTTRVLTIDVDPATTTAQDIVDLLANDPRFRATLAPTDGGVANIGSGVLGTLPADSTLAGGTPNVITGVDANLQQVDGVFTSLSQLRDAIASGNLDQLQAAIAVLDVSADKLSYSRADLGARLKAVDALQSRIATENISLKGAVSQEIEVDFADAISDMATRQAAYEASLRVSAAMTKSTLLDFI